jgi:hypothetical protein
MIDIFLGEALYVVTGYHSDTHSTVFTQAFKSKVYAMEVLNYAQKTVPNIDWDYDYVPMPSVEYAKHLVDLIKEDWNIVEEEDDPTDYIGMGWIDSRGRP